MCYTKHLSLLFCFIVLIQGRKVNQNFPLIEFREINDVKLIIDYKNVEIPLTINIYNDLEEIMQDLTKFNCESDICNAEKRLLIDDILQKNSTLKYISNSHSRSLNRKKREWAPWGNFLKWSGGVMNSEDRNSLHQYLMGLYENQTRMTQQLEKLETKLNQPAELRAERNEEVDKLKNDLQRIKENLRLQNIKEQFSKVSIVMDAVLSSYINKNVDGLLIDEELLNSLDNVRNSLRNDRQFICENSLDCIRNSKAKIVFKNENFNIVIKLPIAAKKTMKLLEINSIPASLSNYVLILKPQHKYILYDEENEELLTLNENILSHCINNDSDEMFCTSEDIMANVNKFDCLFVAHHDKVVDTEICINNMELLELESYGVIKMNKGKYWIYSEAPSAINISCHGDDMESRNVTGVEIITLNHGCHAKIQNMKLTSYSTIDEKLSDSSYANISKESFKAIINMMEPNLELSEHIPYDLQIVSPSGLKEKSQTRDETWYEKSQWQESEIKIIHAEHNRALIVALVITVAALLFIVFRKHKSIFILTNPDKDLKDTKYDQQSISEMEENLKANIK